MATTLALLTMVALCTLVLAVWLKRELTDLQSWIAVTVSAAHADLTQRIDALPNHRAHALEEGFTQLVERMEREHQERLDAIKAATTDTQEQAVVKERARQALKRVLSTTEGRTRLRARLKARQQQAQS